MILLGCRKKSLRGDGTVCLLWEADSESESEISRQEVHKVCFKDHRLCKAGEGKGKGLTEKKKKELRWTLSEHWMTLQRCPELGHEGQAFISTRWPVTGCGAPWDKMVTLRRETSAEATAEGGWQLRAVLFYPHHCWYLGEWGLQSWSCLGSVFHTAHHREEI